MLLSGSGDMAWRAADIVLGALSLPYALDAGYLGVLAVAARRDTGTTGAGKANTRFDVVIPAHNEEAGIERTIASVAELAYPRDRFRIVVVADNCTDDTAARARAAGATVLERTNADARGKGYALSFAFERLLAEGASDAVVVIDADTSVSPNLLHAFDDAIATGADAMQAHYGVRDPNQSWRTRLAGLGLVLFHGVRSLARERLGVSCGLRGNGMCFRASVLARVPHSAYSIVEDLEYGIALGLAGTRVTYVEAAVVEGDMPATSTASRSQRVRWEGGRAQLKRRFAGELLSRAFRERSLMLLDLWFDLIVPPLSAIVLPAVLGLGAALVLWWVHPAFGVALVCWGATLAALALYILRGCAMTGHFARALGDLAWAPLFMIWKLTIRAAPRRKSDAEWTRTTRTTLRKGDL